MSIYFVSLQFFNDQMLKRDKIIQLNYILDDYSCNNERILYDYYEMICFI